MYPQKIKSAKYFKGNIHTLYNKSYIILFIQKLPPSNIHNSEKSHFDQFKKKKKKYQKCFPQTFLTRSDQFVKITSATIPEKLSITFNHKDPPRENSSSGEPRKENSPNLNVSRLQDNSGQLETRTGNPLAPCLSSRRPCFLRSGLLCSSRWLARASSSAIARNPSASGSRERSAPFNV